MTTRSSSAMTSDSRTDGPFDIDGTSATAVHVAPVVEAHNPTWPVSCEVAMSVPRTATIPSNGEDALSSSHRQVVPSPERKV
jgi:hypothetical protein